MMGKYDLDKLGKARTYVVTYKKCEEINGEFVKKFRERNSLTQNVLASILGVTKKAIEKWEQGKNKIGGSSAVLLHLLDTKEGLLDEIFKVEVLNGDEKFYAETGYHENDFVVKSGVGFGKIGGQAYNG